MLDTELMVNYIEGALDIYKVGAFYHHRQKH